MATINTQIAGFMNNSSWIRKMFEAGIEMKKQYGNDNVYDFSLGNPDLPPPPAVSDSLHNIADRCKNPMALGYMPNAGYPAVREAMARKITEEQSTAIPADCVVMSCGAAGGINAFFRAVLEPGDEVACPAPYFVEYDFYASNYGATLRSAPVDPTTFDLDMAAIDRAVTAKTRAFIINSPNNPTGRIYSREEMQALGQLLQRKSEEFGREIYLVSDEPYRFLNYDNLDIPSVFQVYRNSLVIGSFSKTLSLGGERIGYVAFNPAIDGVQKLVAATILTTRILGFVNAPAVAQQLLLECLDSQVDLSIYRKRRDAMAEMLRNAGIEFVHPQGAFYFFPKSPTSDEGEFINALLEEHILAVPGKGFGMSGYIRLTYCMDEQIIHNAAAGFKRAADKFRK